jgi:uncharacterized protein involved in outer membrane biogenesis
MWWSIRAKFIMGMIQQTIQKTLSRLLGADVKFERLKWSPLSGRVEAEGMTVWPEGFEAPLLQIRRIGAEVSVAKALKGQIAIKSLAIEAPVASIIRRGDGMTNLPRRPARSPPSSSGEQSAGPGREMEAQSISITGGQIHVHDQTGGSPYHASVEGIEATWRQQGKEIQLTVTARSSGRQDQAAALGAIQLTGRFANASSLARASQSPLEAELKFTGGPTAKISSPSLASRRVSLELQGPVDLPVLMAMVRACTGDGRLEGTLRMDIDFSKGIHLQELSLRAADVSFGA